jgi:hypothetical protein
LHVRIHNETNRFVPGRNRALQCRASAGRPGDGRRFLALVAVIGAGIQLTKCIVAAKVIIKVVVGVAIGSLGALDRAGLLPLATLARTSPVLLS